MQGLHLTADCRHCECEPELLRNEQLLSGHCTRIINAVKFEIVGQCWHTFAGDGVTGVLLLAESHLAIHSWPEQLAVTLDLYVCNFSKDNSRRAEQAFMDIISLLDPQEYQSYRLNRGENSLL